MKINSGVKNIILACLFFSTINVLVKYLDGIPSVQIVFFRSIVSLFLSGIVVHRLKLKVFNNHTPLLFLRGLFGAMALMLYFHTIKHMPLGAAISILYLSPIFTVILAIFIVKEPPSIKQIPFIALCFIGVLFIKNFDPNISIYYLSMGVIGSLFAGVAYNLIRLLREKVHHQLVIFYFPLVTIPLTLIFLPQLWVNPNLKQFCILILIGVLTQIAQVFMTKAYQQEKAAKIGHYNYLTCVLAYLSGIVFFDEYLNFLSVIGLICIFIGIKYTSKYSS